jgi:hypothetical protein
MQRGPCESKLLMVKKLFERTRRRKIAIYKQLKLKTVPILAVSLTRIADKKSNFLSKIFFFQKVLKFKIYYAKWTLRIEVVNGKKIIYYCNFRVYLVTGPIEGR